MKNEQEELPLVGSTHGIRKIPQAYKLVANKGVTNARQALKNTQPPRVAWDRAETEPCQRLTEGCCIDHRGEGDDICETW